MSFESVSYNMWSYGEDLPENIKDELRLKYAHAETLRGKAKKDTVSISDGAGFYLRSLCMRFHPQIIVEVGTFIGKSTVSMEAEHIYTCDWSNDCLKSSSTITCFPYASSTHMLKQLVEKVKVDMWFFDGRVQTDDMPLIERMSKSSTIYAFDDYRGIDKGVFNVGMFLPRLKGYAFIPPRDWDHEGSEIRIAVLVPEKL